MDDVQVISSDDDLQPAKLRVVPSKGSAARQQEPVGAEVEERDAMDDYKSATFFSPPTAKKDGSAACTKLDQEGDTESDESGFGTESEDEASADESVPAGKRQKTGSGSVASGSGRPAGIRSIRSFFERKGDPSSDAKQDKAAAGVLASEPSAPAAKSAEVVVLEDDQDVSTAPESEEIELGSNGRIATILAKVLQPHQVEGVKFMWKHIGDNKPDGCILAHAMGLGKSLQVVALLHTFYRRQESLGTASNCILVVPTTLLNNWKAEFRKWLPDRSMRVPSASGLDVKVLSAKEHKTAKDRLVVIRQWERRKHGVLIVGYEMLTGMLLATEKSHAALRECKKLLVEAQMVVLDEGHRLKNEKTATAKAMSLVGTKRRVILTGTPLQNNLDEYWTMVDFVRPKFLGTKKRFKDLYSIPIKAGVMSDAPMSDVRHAKRRTFALAKKLEKFVQRKDDSVLRSLLPPKEEIAIYVRLSDFQVDLYRELLLHHSSFCNGGSVDEDGNIQGCKHILGAHAALQRLVNHPDVLHDVVENLRRQENLAAQEKAKEEARAERQRRLWSDESSTTKEVLNLVASPPRSPHAHLQEDEDHRRGDDEQASLPRLTDEELEEVAVDETVGSPGVHRKNVDAEKEGSGISNSACSLPGQDVAKRGDDQQVAAASGGDDACDDGGDAAEDVGELVTSLGLKWARDKLPSDWRRGQAELSGKVQLLLAILMKSMEEGEKVLVFSQYMSTLDMIEAFLRRHKHKASQDKRPFLKHLRLDGKTPQSERLKLVSRFKCPPEQGGAHCFLITTGAGGVGLNLPAASRVVLFDSSWNPATDAQAAVRAFRMGQTKPVFVYRLVSYGAMEGHVYDRSVSKAQLARQVVDKTNVQRMFTSKDLEEMFRLDIPGDPDAAPELNDSARRAMRADKVINSILESSTARWIQRIARHDDATDRDDTEELTKEEEEEALKEDQSYEKYGGPRPPPAPASAPQILSINLPANFVVGTPYQMVALADGRQFCLPVPRGFGPGMQIRFTLPSAS